MKITTICTVNFNIEIWISEDNPDTDKICLFGQAKFSRFLRFIPSEKTDNFVKGKKVYLEISLANYTDIKENW